MLKRVLRILSIQFPAKRLMIADLQALNLKKEQLNPLHLHLRLFRVDMNIFPLVRV